MQKFCGLMDMSDIVDKITFTIPSKQILNSSKTLAKSLCQKAVNQEKEETAKAGNE